MGAGERAGRAGPAGRVDRAEEARHGSAGDGPAEAGGPEVPAGASSGVHCRLDELLVERGLTLTRLSELVGVSLVNLSVLKNDRAKAIRWTTLVALCEALECEIGDLLVLRRA